MAKQKKKRKAERIYDDDPEGEALLPVVKTKELAANLGARNPRKQNDKFPPAVSQVGSKEDGKELFDFVLKKMASPDKQ